MKITSISIFLLLIILAGCASTVLLYQTYQPDEHSRVLILLPKDEGANVLGRVLDHIQDPNFHLITLPESECLNRTETEKLYRFTGRVNSTIATVMAKQVQATLVLYEDADLSPSSPYGDNISSQNKNLHSTNQQDDENVLPSNSNNVEPGKKLRIAIFDVRTETIVWHEILSYKPSESSLTEFANRLVTPQVKK